MFDIGWTELLVIGVVALIVVGPKDLPGMFNTLGRFTAKARGMAREFQRSMEEAARESGVDDIASDLKKVTSPKSLGLDAVKDAVSSYTEPKFDPEASKRRIEESKKVDAEKKAAMGEHTRALAEKRETETAAAKEKSEALRRAAAAADNEQKASPKKARAKTEKPAAEKSPAKAAKAPAKPATAKPAAKPAAKAKKASGASKPKAARKPAQKADT